MLAEFCCAPFSCVSEFFTVFLYIYRICTVPREEGLGLKVCSLILAFWSPVLVLTPSATIDEPLQDKLAKRSQIPRCFATRTLLANCFCSKLSGQAKIIYLEICIFPCLKINICSQSIINISYSVPQMVVFDMYLSISSSYLS